MALVSQAQLQLGMRQPASTHSAVADACATGRVLRLLGDRDAMAAELLQRAKAHAVVLNDPVLEAEILFETALVCKHGGAMVVCSRARHAAQDCTTSTVMPTYRRSSAPRPPGMGSMSRARPGSRRTWRARRTSVARGEANGSAWRNGHINSSAMANRTPRDAASIKGHNPQFLVEKITRTRIYETLYWKESCFALTGARISREARLLAKRSSFNSSNNRVGAKYYGAERA